MRGGFDVCAGFSRALDNAGNEVDPVLGEIVAVVPFRVAIDAVGVLQPDRVNGQLVAERGAVVGAWRDHIKPVDEAGIDLRIEVLPEVSSQGLDHVSWAGAAVGHVDESELNAALVFPVRDLGFALGELGICLGRRISVLSPSEWCGGPSILEKALARLQPTALNGSVQ
jgi:hypothetical protein